MLDHQFESSVIQQLFRLQFYELKKEKGGFRLGAAFLDANVFESLDSKAFFFLGKIFIKICKKSQKLKNLNLYTYVRTFKDKN